MEKNKLTEGKLLPLIISMSLPPIFSMVVQSLYNIVDSIFVAKISSEALTALSVAFPVQNLILALSVGFGTGVNAYIARKMGNKDLERAEQAAAQGLVLSFVHYIVVVGIGLFLSEPFMRLFTDNTEVVKLSSSYTVIIILFSFGQSIQIMIEKILQACGNMIAPMFFQLIGAVTNIILDPILIFGWFGFPAMGIEGAAIATVIGQILAMLAAMGTLIFRKQQLRISFRKVDWDWKMIKEIYMISIPSFLILSIGSIMVSGINLILKGVSEIGVAAFGIYYKLQSFIYMPISGLVQGTLPILSYSYGAKNRVRLLATLRLSLILSTIFGVLGSVLFWLIPTEIMGLFTSDAQLLSMGNWMLRIIGSSFVFGSFCYIFASYFQATGSNFFSLSVTLLRQLFLILPVAWLLSHLMGINGVWLAFLVSEFLTAALTVHLFRKDVVGKTIYINSMKNPLHEK
ncbi:MATE family efflux transporter [Enterococcus sp. BWM-S5]|uniref:Probable multidrug resistance protein NorM n=1 Tax=Enterococcus larvae TaxID=2794352 RepID=A0ABS4CHY9_9ENTE|nr:MATE family efflux transporter [Enterococcus larvae]MBP1046176.1 MATE family efflux transporter [Enterococcus larvae]